MPTALILSGIADGYGRVLLHHLVSLGDFAHIRLVDRHLLVPAANLYLTWVDARTKEVLREGAGKGTIEYVQANLAKEGGSRPRPFATGSHAAQTHALASSLRPRSMARPMITSLTLPERPKPLKPTTSSISSSMQSSLLSSAAQHSGMEA